MARALKDIEQAVERAMDNARGPVDNVLDLIQIAFGLNPWQGTDLVDNMQRIAKKIVHANFEFMRRLTTAKDLIEVMRAQNEYVQSQLGFLSEELKLVTKASKTATDLEKRAFFPQGR